MSDLVDPAMVNYTQDPTPATNIGTDGANNPIHVFKLLELNKDFIIEELIAYTPRNISA